MSNPIAGWYPDPSGDVSKLRYWDGRTWTEHFASAQPAAAPAPGAQETSQQDAWAPEEGTGPQSHTEQLPAQQDTGQGTEQFPAQPADQGTEQLSAQQPADQPTEQLPADQATQQFPPQPTEQFGAPAGGYPLAGGQQGYPQPGYPAAGQPAYGAQQSAPYGAGQPSYGAGQQQSYGQGPGAPYGGPQDDGGGSGKGLIIGIVIAAVVLLGAVIVAIAMLLSSGDDTPAPAPPPVESTPDVASPTPEPEFSPEPTDEFTTPPEAPGADLEGGEIPLGEELTVELAGNDSWTGTLTVTERTIVLIDVVAMAEDFSADDLMIEVIGEDLTVEHDDRGSFLNFGDAGSLDPALGTALEPGDYEVTVRPFFGTAEGDFTLTAHEVELIEPGETISIDVGQDEYWLAAIELDEDTNLVIDTVSSEGDPLLGILTEDGTVEMMDDSTEGEGSGTDPYLEIGLPAGVHFISLADYWADPMVADLSITAAD